MNSTRIARIQRVLDVRQATADRARVELAALTGAAALADQAALDARGAWFAAMNVALREHCSSSDLADAHGYAVTLGHRYEACVRAAQAAAKQRDACQLRLTAARVEVRKLELWKSRLHEEIERSAAGRERRATDELAARAVNTR